MLKQHLIAMRGFDRGVAATVVFLSLSGCGFLYFVQVEVYGAHFWSRPSGLMLRDFGFFWGGARLVWLGHVATVFHPGQFNAWLSYQIAPGTMARVPRLSPPACSPARCPSLVAVWAWPAIAKLSTYHFGLPPIGAGALLAVLFCLLSRMTRHGGGFAEIAPTAAVVRR